MIHPPHYHNPLAVAMPPGFEHARVSVELTSENFADVMAVVAEMVRNGADFIAPPLDRDDLRNELAAAPKRPRKPRLRTMVKQAEAATGKPVTAITLADGTKLDFTKAEQQDNPVDEWIAKHADKTQRH
jgi:hypothetical protein